MLAQEVSVLPVKYTDVVVSRDMITIKIAAPVFLGICRQRIHRPHLDWT